MKTKNLLAIVIPLLVMAIWMGTHTYHKYTAPTVLLKVTGYDPRDLLSGHFLRYQVDYGSLGTCKNISLSQANREPICQCLEKDSKTNISKSSWSGVCTDKPSDNCSLWIRGVCDYSSLFTANIERYYFPEKYTTVLQTIPPNSTIQVSLTGMEMPS